MVLLGLYHTTSCGPGAEAESVAEPLKHTVSPIMFEGTAVIGQLK